MAKKKAAVDMTATFKNGMNKERTKQATLQGLMLLVYMCGLGVFSYIVSMIPAGLFGIMIVKDNTTNQTVYDVQNIALCVLGLVICSIGGYMLVKKCGENDAVFAFRNNFDRNMDSRYLLVSVVVGVTVYFFMSAVMNIDFFAGPIRYLGIFLTRAERSINEGIKVGIGYRLLATLICLVIEVPCLIKGIRVGFKESMKELCDGEEKEARRAKEREEAEIAYQNRRKDKNR